ncbi:TlpA family protein disulfide reductase [Mucilaginibacter sp. BJC16-A38]|uniref:TlpA family protein disulfide reductase n=1 Tax=Mucilaginibacter phenanthrenivorans TaxID=1234842 RepID=UPI002157CE0A|nr:TlpA disulfide reductase family protein [Mucilaginibacter phenanthrenivorans]MCR8560765.1 TlpA family protein disulfide reductase [Mucilaginibacter phenanthrenivorans]
MKKTLYTVACCLLMLQASAQQQYATITCKLYSLNSDEAVNLVSDKYGTPIIPGIQRIYAQKLVNHVARFKIPVGNFPMRFHVKLNRIDLPLSLDVYRRMNYNYYLEAGDNIVLTESNGKLNFSGKGSFKFKVADHIDALYFKYDVPISHASSNGFCSYAFKADTAYLEKIKYLRNNKTLVSPAMARMFEADILGDYLARFYVLHYSSSEIIRQVIDSLQNCHPDLPENVIDRKSLYAFNESAYSFNLAFGINAQYTYDSCYSASKPINLLKAYNDIKATYKGLLRERLVVQLLYQNTKSTTDFTGLAEDALSYVKAADLHAALQKLIANHQVGKQAFNFELPDTNGRMHRLSDYKGKVILLDFWFNGCGNCRDIEPYLKTIENKFEGKPVIFISINVDKEKERWLRGIRSGLYTTKGGLDLYTTGRGDQDATIRNFDVTASGYPTLIIIDKDGKMMRNPKDPRGDNGGDLTDLIESAIR